MPTEDRWPVRWQGVQINLGGVNTQHNEWRYAEPTWQGAGFDVPALTGSEVGRYDLIRRLITELVDRPDREPDPAGRMVGVVGSGGFGKTTLAKLVAHVGVVREQFADGIRWLFVGEHAGAAEIAMLIDDLNSVMMGAQRPIGDPGLAAARLARHLHDRRVLVVLDDVWSTDQLEPFRRVVQDAPTVRVLFTSRHRTVAGRRCTYVPIDAMAGHEAASLLLQGLPEGDAVLVGRLLDLTGRWPLLLSLANGAIHLDLSAGLDAHAALRDLTDALAEEGPAVLDPEDEQSRDKAVTATMRTSLRRLGEEERRRYLEMSIFEVGIDVPRDVLTRYWAATGGWSSPRSDSFCRRLWEHSLLSDYRMDDTGPRVRVHDVVQRWLRSQGDDKQRLHGLLLSAHHPLVTESGEEPIHWYRLRDRATSLTARFLWDVVPGHLIGAGRHGEARELVGKAPWIIGKVAVCGPSAMERDLRLVEDRWAGDLTRIMQQDGHLFSGLRPDAVLATTLAARTAHLPSLAELGDQLRSAAGAVFLSPVGHPPDLAHPLLRRVLAHGLAEADTAYGIAASPDGRWLACFSARQIDIWEPNTGQRLAVLPIRSRPSAVTVASDGTWLAVVDADGLVQVCDPYTAESFRWLRSASGRSQLLTAMPDGTLLVACGADGVIRVWDVATGDQRASIDDVDPLTLMAGPGSGTLIAGGRDGFVSFWDVTTGARVRPALALGRPVYRMAMPATGEWLATAGARSDSVTVWNLAAGTVNHAFRDVGGMSRALIAAPDGSWLASAGLDSVIRTWDARSGAELGELRGHSALINALAAAPDGSRLVSAGADRTVRVWAPRGGAAPELLTGHDTAVQGVAVHPRGNWIASCSFDSVRLWDAGRSGGVAAADPSYDVAAVAAPRRAGWVAGLGRDGTVRIHRPGRGSAATVHDGHIRWMCTPADGRWLATVSETDAGEAGADIRVWDTVSGRPLRLLTGHQAPICDLAADPGGRWLAAAALDGTVRIWNPDNEECLRAITAHDLPIGLSVRLVVPDDGQWLAWSAVSLFDDVPSGLCTWDMAGRVLWRTEAKVSSIASLRLERTGFCLALVDDGRVVRVHRPDGEPIAALPLDAAEMATIRTAPAGGWVRVESLGSLTRVWRPEDETVIGLPRLDVGTEVVAGSPDGRWVSVAGEDNMILVWDATTGAAVTALRAASRATSLAWSDDFLVAGTPTGPSILRVETNGDL